MTPPYERILLAKSMKHIHFLPWLLIGALCAAAFYLRFVLWGYSFSALVCCCLAGIIAFYEVTGILLPRFPAAVPMIRRVFTVCLAIGIAVVTGIACLNTFKKERKKARQFMEVRARTGS